MVLTSGTKLGPYEVSGAIGAGGMGEVYLAPASRSWFSNAAHAEDLRRILVL